MIEWVHRATRLLHWPLYLVSLLTVFVAIGYFFRSNLDRQIQLAMAPIVTFWIILGLLWFLSLLPRYSWPLRPLSYLIVSFLLCLAISYGKRKFSSRRRVTDE
jgi:hypothetical protein